MEDAIELNLAPSTGSISARKAAVIPKGGRWMERAKARKDLRREKPPSVVPAAQNGPSATSKESIQRRSADGGGSVDAALKELVVHRDRPVVQAFRPSNKADSQPRAGPSRQRNEIGNLNGSAPTPKTTSHPQQVISSLFSSNPTYSAPRTNTPTATPVAGPSNAPLADSSTFEGLGLDAMLRRHLKGKMSVQQPTAIQRTALPYMLSTPLDANASRTNHTEDDGDEDIGNDAELSDDNQLERPRDVFIQSQTGSGKTLTYLLPIVQALLPLSRLSYIDRSIGTLAIILAPTRELAQQISKVLEQLLSLSLASEDDDDRPHMTRWLVSGLLTGGSTKTHEKAKLRKGVPILVATPGRLLDHLQNTTAFRFAKTMFLVLDEADRLMDLGFEETIRGIIKALEGRRRAEMDGEKTGEVGQMKWNYWGRGRQNILCSATVDAKVEKLAGVALADPVVFRAKAEIAPNVESSNKAGKTDPEIGSKLETPATAIALPTVSEKFTPPSQLSQKYIVVPTKLRLVTLVALVRTLVGRKGKDDNQGAKVIVFMSSTDEVDFHWKLLGGIQLGSAAGTDQSQDTVDEDEKKEMSDAVDGEEEDPAKLKKINSKKSANKQAEAISLTSSLFPSTAIHRLHGSLPLKTRLASLSSFSTSSPNPSILICTSVASRGLDLPLVRSVVQYDLPTEGGANEYVHRVGRTARAGKGGEAWSFVGPSEVDWVEWVKSKMGTAEGKEVRFDAAGVEDVLKKGFGGKGFEFERRATEVQGGFEKWVLSNDANASLARKAYGSLIRAYSTHPLEEKKFFHPKSLHLGHLAKSFALREAPSNMSQSSKSTLKGNNKRKRGEALDDDDSIQESTNVKNKPRNETEKRMYDAVRAKGREIRQEGKMGQFGNLAGGQGEYQIMDSAELGKMLGNKV